MAKKAAKKSGGAKKAGKKGGGKKASAKKASGKKKSAKSGSRKTSSKGAAKTIVKAATKAPRAIAKEAKAVAEGSRPYLKAAVQQERKVGGRKPGKLSAAAPGGGRSAGRLGPAGKAVGGVAEVVVKKAVGLVAGKSTATKAAGAAAQAVGKIADEAALAAAQKAVEVVTRDPSRRT